MALMVYITAPTPEEARSIAAHIVGQRLAACANIFDAMTSIFHWKGAVEESRETVCLFKTEDHLFEPLREAVCAMHSYTTPCIVALPLVEGDADFLAWLRAETRPRA